RDQSGAGQASRGAPGRARDLGAHRRRHSGVAIRHRTAHQGARGGLGLIFRFISPLALTHPVSLPGLTRQSILFDEELFSMDARVKPGHDESKAKATDIRSASCVVESADGASFARAGGSLKGAATLLPAARPPDCRKVLDDRFAPRYCPRPLRSAAA